MGLQPAASPAETWRRLSKAPVEQVTPTNMNNSKLLFALPHPALTARINDQIIIFLPERSKTASLSARFSQYISNRHDLSSSKARVRRWFDNTTGTATISPVV